MNTKHFKSSEFACRHCGETKINSELIVVLELVRMHFNSPVTINSSYRCPTHNKAVGGADKSQHLLGTAADIVVKGVTPAAVYQFVDTVFPNSYGLGRYDNFTHVDVRNYKARW